jgi:uncharacterized delta-60 repeat protein
MANSLTAWRRFVPRVERLEERTLLNFGSLDLGFGTGGRATTAVGAQSVSDMALQDDGKVIVVGAVHSAAAGLDFAVVRYNADGTLDDSFASHGIFTADFFGGDDSAKGVALQADLSIVVGGLVNGPSGQGFGLLRLTSSGVLDSTFGTLGKTFTLLPGSTVDVAKGLVIQSTGNIVIGGDANGFALARYDSSGHLDPSFGSGGIVITPPSPGFVGDFANALTRQTDDELILVGTSPSLAHSDRAIVARYAADGKSRTLLDAGLRNAEAVAVQPDAKIVVAGQVGTFFPTFFKLVRLNADGSIDTSFASAETLGNQLPAAILVQADGNIITSLRSDGFFLTRDTPDGHTDPTFGSNGIVRTDFPAGASAGAFGLAERLHGFHVLTNQVIAVGAAGRDFVVARYVPAVQDLVFVRYVNGEVWEHVGSGFQKIDINASQISTGVDSQGGLSVFIVYQNHELFEWSPFTGFHFIDINVARISASHLTADTVFIIYDNGELFEHNGTGAGFRFIDVNAADVSAGLDVFSPPSQVQTRVDAAFIRYQNNFFFEWSTANGFRFIDVNVRSMSASATTENTVYIVYLNNELFLHDALGFQFIDINVTDVSAGQTVGGGSGFLEVIAAPYIRYLNGQVLMWRRTGFGTFTTLDSNAAAMGAINVVDSVFILHDDSALFEFAAGVLEPVDINVVQAAGL